MKKTIALLLVFLPSIIISAQSIYSCKNGEVSFFSESPLENIEAHNKSVNSILNISTREIVFIVPIRGFKFPKPLMEEHFNEKYLESDKYTDAVFKGRINEEVDFLKDGITKVTATGKLKIHGVEKEVMQPGAITVKGGVITLVCDFHVLVKDYNITIPSLMFKNIAEDIAVKLTANYTPYKK